MKKFILFVTLILTSLFANTVCGKTFIMPQELVELAEKQGCNQVNNFYDRPGMVRPSYVYGYLPGLDGNSAVFWCEKKENAKEKYYLLFMFKNTEHELIKCPNKIEWHGSPRGLSIFKDKNTTLEKFVNINKPDKKPPKNTRLTHNAILSEYDGVENLFYCYKKEWFVRQRH